MKRILLAVLLLGSITASAAENLTIEFDSIKAPEGWKYVSGKVNITNYNFTISTIHNTDFFSIIDVAESKISTVIWGETEKGELLGLEIFNDGKVYMRTDEKFWRLKVKNVKRW